MASQPTSNGNQPPHLEMQMSLAYDKLANTRSTDCLVGECDWSGHPYACYTITAAPAIGPLLLAMDASTVAS